MKTVFGDMSGRLGELIKSKAARNAKDLFEWLTEDMSEKIDENKDEMEMVLRGIKNSIKDPDRKEIGKAAANVMTRWLVQILKNRVSSNAREALAEAVTDKNGEVMAKVYSMIDDLLAENHQEG